MKEKIIVFGRGAYYQTKREMLFEKFQVIAFLDNNALNEDFEEGIPVYKPEMVFDFPQYRIIIMAARRYFLPMAQQLRRLGIVEKRIELGMNMAPYFDSGEELIHNLHGTVVIEGDEAHLCCDAGEYRFQTEAEYQSIVRDLSMERNRFAKIISDFPVQPVSRRFGLECGKAIDRYYMESFLEAHRELIHGVVLEIADTIYTRRYGCNVVQSLSLHVENWGGTGEHIYGNLETGEGIPENAVDCLICTQTIQMIYDIHSVVRNIHKLLKPGGVALITAHGISQLSMNDYNNWGEYWRFTRKSMERLLGEAFAPDSVTVETWGNAKTTIAFLYGLCQEDLSQNDFVYNDEQYPLIVTAICREK